MASVLLYFLHLYVFFWYVFGSKDIFTTVVIKIKSICTTTRITAKTFQLTFYEITLQYRTKVVCTTKYIVVKPTGYNIQIHICNVPKNSNPFLPLA